MAPLVGDVERFDRTVRSYVFATTAATGRVPTTQEVADALGQVGPVVAEAFQRLASRRDIVLAPGAPNIWMANPFSAVPTMFRVFANGRTYFGNCIWDALGIPAALGADGRIETRCGDCGAAMALEVRGGELASGQGLLHFGVPAAHWWDNIGYT